MKCFKRVAIILLLIILTDLSLFSQEKAHLTKVVIDAGHGGKDPGALGKKIQEKKVTLQVVLKLGEMIKEGCPDVNVYYTRDKDEFIELYQRAGLANRVKADLFISIHCNSNPAHSFRGTETYVMGLHKSEANLAIAKQENASILLEQDYTTTYNGFDPNSDESYILFTLYQDAYLEQSTDFASIVQDEMKSRVGLHDRGVRQAGFLVLYKTTMPSVLVETGFLSNPEEEKFLSSEAGQEYIASAVFRAFRRFKAKMEGTSEIQGNKVIASETNKPKEVHSGKEKLKKKEVQEERKPEHTNAVSFRVQVLISPKDIGMGASKLEGLKNVKMYKHQGMFKYTTGNETSLDAALKLQEEVQKKGFHDAFVVAFKGEDRITIAEAKRLTGDK